MKNTILCIFILLLNIDAIAQPCNITSNTISASSTSICSGSSVQINGSLPSGAATFSYSWLQSTVITGPYSIIVGETTQSLNTGSLTVPKWFKRIVNITCSPSGTDRDTSAAIAITVVQLPTVNAGSAIPAICQGATTIALGGSFAGSATGAVWTLNNITDGTLSNPTNANSATYTASSNAPSTVTLTLTSTGGICTPATITKTITVNPKPIIVSSQNLSTCSESLFTINPQNGSGNNVPPGTTYTWAISSNPSLTGGSAQTGTGLANVSQTLTNTSNTLHTINYTITPATSQCPGANFTAIVSVNPKPNVTSSQTQTVCSDSPFSINPSNGNGNIVPAGTTYTWAAPSISGVNNSAAGSNSSSISGDISSTLNNSIDIPYIVTPTSGTCPGNQFTATIIVNPVPSISSSNPPAICSGNPFSTISPVNGNGNIVPSGTTYTWTVSSNLNLTGASTQTSEQTNISQILNNVSNSQQQITYSITPKAGLCSGSNFTALITVNPKPVISISAPTPICSGNSFGPIVPSDGNGNIVPSNTTYTWTVTSNPSLTEISAQNTGQGSIGQTISNTSNVQQLVTYTITPTAGLCSGSNFTALVTVNPKPFVPTQSIVICSDSSFSLSPTNGSGNIIPSQTVFSWSAPINNSVDGLLGSTNSNIISGSLFSTTYVNHDITYSVTPSTLLCPGSPFNVNVTLLRKPNIIAIDDQQICSGNSVQLNAADLFGNQNLFYNWSQSPDISTLNFPNISNPLASPSDNALYIVNVIDPNTQCVSSDSVSVIVIQVFDLVIVSDNPSLCQGQSTNLSLNNIQADWYANGQLIESNVNQVEVSPLISTVYSAFFQNEACVLEDEITLNVNSNPNPLIIGSSTVCNNSYWQEYHVNSSTNHGYTWNLDNGSVMSGQGTNTALVHWFNETSGSIDVTEHIWETGCEASTSIDVSFSGLAPNPSTVTQLASGSNILICSDSTFSIYNWGYESVTTSGVFYVNTHTQYCQFPIFDPTSYYYFVDHGSDSECLTRSYFNTPPTVVGIEENTNKFGIILYPNPANEFVSINLDYLNSNKSIIEIFSLSGSLVYSSISVNEKLKSVDISRFKKGLYLVKVLANDRIYHSRFIKD